MARLRLCRRWPSPGLGNSEIPGQRNGLEQLRPLFQCRSVCNSERSAGERGRARGELKTVRLGAATRERFLEGEGEKRFGVAAGCHAALVPPKRRRLLVPGFGDPCSLGD